MLESLGIIEVGRGLGYAGSSLFFLHKDKLAAFLTPLSSFTKTAREAFSAALEAGKTMLEWKEANDFFNSPMQNHELDLSYSHVETDTHTFHKYRVWWTCEEAALEAKNRCGF